MACRVRGTADRIDARLIAERGDPGVRWQGAYSSGKEIGAVQRAALWGCVVLADSASGGILPVLLVLRLPGHHTSLGSRRDCRAPPANDRDRRPDEFHDPEWPRSGKEAIGAGEDATGGEGEGVARSAPL